MENNPVESLDRKTTHDCDVCGKHFINKDFLAKHKKMHTKKQQISIFQLFQNIDNNPVLSSAQKIRHECDICGNLYINKHNLVKHKKIHTAEKKFSCDICQESFRLNVYLVHHKKIHTKGFP